MNHWHLSTAGEALESLKSNKFSGLSNREAELRREQFGPNLWSGQEATHRFQILIRQFSSTLVLILIGSMAVSLFLGDLKNALSIGAIVILNGLLGFTQEARAEKALQALKKLATPTVKVKRETAVREISASEVVPGDIVVLEAGNIVAADGRILESHNLQIQESALTGESLPVEKTSDPLTAVDVSLAERANMGYAGTFVSHGRGLMIVTDSGPRTEVGKIASMVRETKPEMTPLQRRLNQVGNRLALIALGIVALIFFWGVLRGENITLMFMTAVSIAVAAVPEGLPAIVTINLAFGAQRMLRRRALIRHLPAVETLGSVTVICTDKTGTLTENKMSVAFLDVADHEIDLRNTGINRIPDEPVPALERRESLSRLLTAAALCNDALLQSADNSQTTAIGDPTETALVLAAARFGLLKNDLEQARPRVAEFPFDPARKRMSTVHRQDGSSVVYVKGALDSVLSVSRGVLVDNQEFPLDEQWRNRIHQAQDKLAQTGMRVLGVAYRKLDADLQNPNISEVEKDLNFVGLIGLMDPIRKEVKSAVQSCLTAGIRPVMITGDHPLTAGFIGRELGFPRAKVVTGTELDNLSEADFDRLVGQTFIYARVSPEHKLNIVQALQKKGHVVAMTGDGVNDAPALKRANIGVSMGITGTEVAKEASDMVLLDDNFATIVDAVKEGRAIYANIRRSLRYLLTGNVGEIGLMLFGPLLGMPLPLLPIQVLWMNLITDGLPALALGIEPAEKDVMSRPPVNPAESIFARGMGRGALWLGAMVGIVPLAVGLIYWAKGSPVWQTMTFNTLINLHILMAFAFRSDVRSIFQLGFLTNKAVLAAVALSITLQAIVVYAPVFQAFFNTAALSPRDFVLSLVLSTSVFWIAEAEKWMNRRRVL